MPKVIFNIHDIANWLLSKQSMTPKKLQKMLFYEYAWFLILFNDDKDDLNNKLFNDKFEAWVHGPVNPEIYRNYKEYGYQDIPQNDINSKLSINDDVLSVLETVYNTYSQYNGNELENITHHENPWKEARGNCRPLDKCNSEIDDKSIYEYYTSLADLN